MTLDIHDIQAATRAIASHEKLLITPHANVDPDGLSSALACYKLFTALGKDCTVICPDTLPESLKFLPGYEHLETAVTEGFNFVITLDTSGGIEVDKLRYTVEDQKVNIIVTPKKGRLKKENVSILESGANYDLIIVVDSAELNLLGSVYLDHIDLFNEVPILNIDHHVSNTQFGQILLIDSTCASATEVLYNWFASNPQWKEFITADMATLLLTGLITDTRSFQNPNTTPRSLEVAADLIDLGARQQEIIQNIYKTKPLSTLKIWGRALNSIQFDPASRIVWAQISKEDLTEMGATSKETSGILDELISTIPDADVHVLFTELEQGGLKASLRSSLSIDVNQLASSTFGGGGHARAAGFTVKKFSNFQLQVVECVQKLKEHMESQRQQEDEAKPRIEPMTQSVAAASIPQTQSVQKKKEEEKKGVDVLEKLL